LDYISITISFLTGSILGIFVCILLSWSSQVFLNKLAPIVLGGLPIAGTYAINSLTNSGTIDKHDLLSNLIGFFIAFSIMFFMLYKSVKGNNLTFSHLMFGVAKQHLDIEKQKKTIEADKNKISEKEQENLNKEKELENHRKELKQKEVELLESHNGHLMNVISEESVPILSGGVHKCASFHGRVTTTLILISKATDLWLDELLNPQKEPEDSLAFKDLYLTTISYLQDISMTLNEHLMFGHGTRVCIRIQKSEFTYKSITAHYGSAKKKYTHPISDIPLEGSLIGYSNDKGGKPVIYSLNKSKAIAPKGQWEDFLTIAFSRPLMGDKPLLSLTISVEDHLSHIDFFKFLCHTRFDKSLRSVTERFFQSMKQFDYKDIATTINFAQKF